MASNNPNLYNAALAGASAGVSSRVIVSTDPAFYATQAAQITNFAVAFDAQIAPIVGGGSRGQSSVVTDICAAYWRDRIITNEADLFNASAALAALYAAIAPSLEPDSGGSGGSGTIYPGAISSPVSIPDDGAYHDILAVEIPVDEAAICVVAITIDPDVALSTPDGSVRILDPAGATTDLQWGPLVANGILYLTFSSDGTTQGFYTLQAAVTAATGDCTATSATMLVVQL